MKKVTKIIGSLLLITGVLWGGAYYWNWNTLHHSAVISEPTLAQADITKEEKSKQPPPKFNSRINILVLGTDNSGDEAARSDTMMLVSANVDTHHISMISIPRDTRVDLPGVGLTKINHANALGEMRNGVHEGTLESAKATSNLLGVPINYYVKINFQGFQKAVDAVGGIEVTLLDPVNSDDIQLSAGTHQLTGDQALRLSQARYGLANGDFDRQRDQFYLLSALAHQMLSLDDISKLQETINTVYQDLMDTNMSAAEMAAMGLNFKEITKEEMKYYQLPGKGITAYDPLVGAELYYYEPDMDGVKKVMQQALED